VDLPRTDRPSCRIGVSWIRLARAGRPSGRMRTHRPFRTAVR